MENKNNMMYIVNETNYETLAMLKELNKKIQGPLRKLVISISKLKSSINDIIDAMKQYDEDIIVLKDKRDRVSYEVALQSYVQYVVYNENLLEISMEHSRFQHDFDILERVRVSSGEFPARLTKPVSTTLIRDSLPDDFNFQTFSKQNHDCSKNILPLLCHYVPTEREKKNVTGILFAYTINKKESHCVSYINPTFVLQDYSMKSVDTIDKYEMSESWLAVWNKVVDLVRKDKTDESIQTCDDLSSSSVLIVSLPEFIGINNLFRNILDAMSSVANNL